MSLVRSACWVLLCAILCSSCPVAALEGPTAALEQLFADVPHDLAPSGVLHDRVLALAGVDELDGSSPAPVIPAARWRQAWWEMRRATSGPVTWMTAGALRERVAATPSTVVPVGVLDQRYDRIRPDALRSGAVAPGGEGLQLRPAALESAELFCAAALREATYHGERVVFDLSRQWWFGNRERTAVELWFDPDDGAGARLVDRDRLVVRSHEPGAKTIRLRARWSDGSVQEAAFRFEVAALVVPAPDDTLRLTASVPYDGAVASGDAWVYLAGGRSALTRPVVMVEGFDLDNSLGWPEIYTLLNTENLLEDLRADGFDLVVLNFDDATDFIQRNSLLVVELLESVQAVIDPRARFAVAGASMGALCTRYALAWMEQNARPHRVDTWLSFDGPHRGANIPVGLQYWLDFFSGESAEAAFLLERLDRPAARQLLAYHHTDPPGAVPAADPLRGAFEADLAALGGYPTQPRRVAIANGSGTALDQGYPAGSQLLQWEYDSFLVDIRGNVWAVADGASQRVFEGRIDPVLLPATTQDVIVSDTAPFDNAPGGSRASLAQADSTAAPYGDIVALEAVHCFIPTVSALDLPAAALFLDVSAELDPAALSPFDAVYFPTENQDHVLVTAENAQWFRQELLATPTAVVPSPGRGLVLHGAYPNPFNPATGIRFETFGDGRVQIDVFDVRGARVATLLDEARPAGRGRVVWDGTDARGRRVGSGVYHCRVRAQGLVRTTSVVLLK